MAKIKEAEYVLLTIRQASQRIHKACHRIPSWLAREMLYNNLISFVVGLVPIFGCFGVSVLKCNSRNAGLLDEFLALRGAEYFKGIYEGPQRYTEDIKPGAGLGNNEVPDDSYA